MSKCTLSRRQQLLLAACALNTTMGCASPATPTGVPPGAPPAIAITVGITDATSIAFVDGDATTYRIFATVAVAGAGVSIDRVSLELTRPGAQPWTLSRSHSLRVEPHQPRSLYLDLRDNDASRPFASAVVVTLEYSSDDGRRGTHVFTPPLRGMGMPSVAASLAPGAIASGQSTTLQWDAAEVTTVRIAHLDDVFPARGSLRLTPCPGQTTFTVSASNLSGDAVSGDLTVSVSRPVGVASVCGSWSGTAEGTRTDSVEGVSQFSGHVSIAVFQFQQRLEGRWHLSAFLRDSAFGDLAGRLAGDSLTATVEYAGPASGERSTCVSEVSARLSGDESELVGTYQARCRKDGRHEVAYDGRFSARRIESMPYPRLP